MILALKMQFVVFAAALFGTFNQFTALFLVT